MHPMDLPIVMHVPGRRFIEFFVEMDLSQHVLDDLTDLFDSFGVNIVNGLITCRPREGKRILEIFSDFSEATLPLEKFVGLLRSVKGVFNVEFKEGFREGLAISRLQYPPRVLGEEAVIFRRSVLESWFKRLWRMFKTGASTILYESGVESGRNAAKIFRERLGLDGEELIRFIAGVGQPLGWGVFDFLEVDMERFKATVNIKNSFECLILKGEIPGPASNFVRGYMVGVAREVWRKDETAAEEVKCIAKGDPYCQIKVFLKS